MFDVSVKDSILTYKFMWETEVKKFGVHQTKNIEITEVGTKLRKFSPSSHSKTAWLTVCEERKSLYCFYYFLLFGGELVWSKADYSDLIYLSEKKHECSVV